MPYITSVERIGIRKGREEGLEEGRQQGMQQGQVEGKREMLRRLVQIRFGSIPEALESRIAAADEAALDRLLERVVEARSVDEI